MGFFEERVKSIFDEMKITKAVIIDDQYGKDMNEELLDILRGKRDTVDFCIGDEIEALEYNLYEIISRIEEGEDLEGDILRLIYDKFPDMRESKLDIFIKVLGNIIDPSEIEAYNNTEKIASKEISHDTILFLDYQLEEGVPPYSSEILTKYLSEKSADFPRCIVFMSNSPFFYINEKEFKMSNPVDKSQYIRELRRSEKEKDLKNSLYDFIDKKMLNSEDNILKALYEVFQNLYGGRIFFSLLSSLNNMLQTSSEEVLNKFHLLNARSIQELIRSKVEKEGISESVFFMEWISRNISKEVIRNDKAIKDIYNSLDSICKWSQPFNELHEDVALQEILLSEMWDDKVNQRYEPITFGDVFEFEVDNEKRQAILMTQQCTLAIRGDGTRSGTIGMFVFRNQSNKKTNSPSVLSITDWLGGEFIISFDETITYCLDLLDLTTLNNNGKAIIKFKEKNEMVLPNAVWSKGYVNMMDSLGKKLLDKINASTQFGKTGFMQLNQTWTPFEITTSTLNEGIMQKEYEFPIRRVCRLDYQYALHIFQKAQSWWGRIGLPVNLNFMEDYKPREGTIVINNSSEYRPEFLVRMNGNEINDIGIQIKDLIEIIQKAYGNSSEAFNEIGSIFQENENIIARIKCASGRKIISLKEDTNGMKILKDNGINIRLIDENLESIKCDITTNKFNSYYFNGEECDASKFNVKFDSRGEINIDIIAELLDKYTFLRENKDTSKKFITKGTSEVFRISSSINKYFDIKISNGCDLYISISKELIGASEDAAITTQK